MSFPDQAEAILDFIGWKSIDLFVQLGSQYSAASLLFALCVAVVLALLKRNPAKRNVPIKVMARALFPQWIWRSRSLRADFGYLILNGFAAGILFGWSLLSAQTITRDVHAGL